MLNTGLWEQEGLRVGPVPNGGGGQLRKVHLRVRKRQHGPPVEAAKDVGVHAHDLARPLAFVVVRQGSGLLPDDLRAVPEPAALQRGEGEGEGDGVGEVGDALGPGRPLRAVGGDHREAPGALLGPQRLPPTEPHPVLRPRRAVPLPSPEVEGPQGHQRVVRGKHPQQQEDRRPAPRPGARRCGEGLAGVGAAGRAAAFGVGVRPGLRGRRLLCPVARDLEGAQGTAPALAQARRQRRLGIGHGASIRASGWRRLRGAYRRGFPGQAVQVIDRQQGRARPWAHIRAL